MDFIQGSEYAFKFGDMIGNLTENTGTFQDFIKLPRVFSIIVVDNIFCVFKLTFPSGEGSGNLSHPSLLEITPG